MVISRRYMVCGMWKIENPGYKYNKAMLVRYVEGKRPCVNIAKVRTVWKYCSKKCKGEQYVIYGKYIEPTTALGTLEKNRYKYVAATRMYKGRKWPESIEAYIEEKAGGKKSNSVPKRYRSAGHKYVMGSQVCKRSKATENVKVYTDEKAGESMQMKQALDKSSKIGIVYPRLIPLQTGNIETAAVYKYGLVCEENKVSVIYKPNISVSWKMDQRTNSGDQVMETNHPQQAAPSGEYCSLFVSSALMLLCPIYVLFNPNAIHPSDSLIYNVRACYTRPVIHIYVCNMILCAINMTYVPKYLSIYMLSVVLEESSWYGRYGE
jgi:hypothetical protein